MVQVAVSYLARNVSIDILISNGAYRLDLFE